MEHSDLTLSATQKEQEIAENTSDNRNNLIIQFEIKSRLLLFFKRVLQSGFILENNTSGRNTTEKEMISYIQQNFTRKISLKEFGNQFHLSEKYISRYFKEHFHITISQYINHLRILLRRLQCGAVMKMSVILSGASKRCTEIRR